MGEKLGPEFTEDSIQSKDYQIAKIIDSLPLTDDYEDESFSDSIDKLGKLMGLERGKFLGKLMSGQNVFDRFNSHLNVHQNVLNYLPEGLSKLDTGDQKFLIKEVDFGKTVGTTNCILTKENDTIIYAKRIGREGYTRFVQARDVMPSSKMTIILLKNSDTSYSNDYTLITAWIGTKAEPEPWDQKLKENQEAEEKAKNFWSSHALIFDQDTIVPGTETKECPWD